MIRRDQRNIGKIVEIQGHKHFDGECGKVVGFREDFDRGIPYVEVFVYRTGSVWPFPGSSLRIQKKPARGNPMLAVPGRSHSTRALRLPPYPTGDLTMAPLKAL